MKTRILLGTLLVLALAATLWILTGEDGGGAGVGPAPALAPGNRGPVADVQLEAGGDQARDAAAGPARVEAAGGAPPSTAAAEDPWADQLGGATGRVVEEDGAPVPGIPVALVQADANLLLAADWLEQGLEPAEFVLDTTLTDEEGRFLLRGAYDQAFHALGIDLRGPRSTLRVLDTQLHHGELTDLGDIVLRSGCTVTGRIVDESGEPVPGVRVRIAPAPQQGRDVLLKLGLQDFRSDCSVAVSRVIAEGGVAPVIELPPLVRQHLDDLPVPTATTDREGRYRFEGVLVGEVLLAFDRPGALGDMRLETTEPGEVELADGVLRAGRTLGGVVVDLEGEPVAGAEVLVGCEVFLGEAAILHPAGVSAADGSFSLGGLPLTGSTVAAARRTPGDPWVAAIAGAGEELEVELEEAFDLTVRLVDVAGQPVEGARVALRPAADLDAPMGVLGRFMDLGAPPRPPRFEEREGGVYVAADVTPGSYHVEARPRELSPVIETHELWSGEAEVTLTCPAGAFVDVTVLDAASAEPVGAARASIVRVEDFVLLRSVASGRTGSEGTARLGPFDPAPQTQRGGIFGGSQETRLLVQHPAYADSTTVLDPAALVVRVDLVRGGEVRGLVRWGSELPGRPYMVVLSRRDENSFTGAFTPPRLARSGLDGAFRITSVPPGTYRLELYERWFDQNPIELLVEQKEPTLVHRENELLVEAGTTTEVLVDLSPDGNGQTARVAGSLRLDGRPLEGASVRVWSTGWSRATTDAAGSFETGPFLVGRTTTVRIEAEIGGEDGEGGSEVELYREAHELTPGETLRLDLDLATREVTVVVLDADGAAMPDVEVEVNRSSGGSGSSATTDGTGTARIAITGSGSFSFQAEAAGFQDARTEVEIGEGALPDQVELVLRPAIPCAGTCDLRSLDYATLDQAYLMIDRGGSSEWVELEIDDVRDDGMAAFSVDGVAAGELKARFWLGGSMSPIIELELPEGGSETLLIVHP